VRRSHDSSLTTSNFRKCEAIAFTIDYGRLLVYNCPLPMSNLEELISLAESAGLKTTAITSDSSTHTPSRFSGAIDRAGQCFSLCIAAAARDEGLRYRPFNSGESAGKYLERNAELMRAAARALAPTGWMFVYGLPRDLFRYAVLLSDEVVFRHWIAVRAMTGPRQRGLRPEHTGLLALSKPGAKLNRCRIPHARCRACSETLKDWGGKSHLMHPAGVALSDVWMDLVVDPGDRMPREVFERVINLSSNPDRSNLLLLVPGGQPSFQQSLFDPGPRPRAFDPLGWKRAPQRVKSAQGVPPHLIDNLHEAPCVEVLKRIPSKSVDLAFADPPFNLTKGYNGYADDRADGDYVGWCKRWLVEYERVLKPGGAIFLLNLPKWSVQLADFLCRRKDMHLQSWIVWNSLPEPKGVLMPAHYTLLYFTKGPEAARFNYCSMEKGWEPFDEAVFPPDRPDVCQRRSCLRKRRASASVWRGELTDIWYDIHRVRQPVHAAMTAKAHPCETPERLIDRIIRLATNPGDVVLDAFAGTGTTAMVARRLGRRFIAIEQADEYVRVAGSRVSEPRSLRRPNARAAGVGISKRSLQLELKRLAVLLGRLPDKRDVEELSNYEASEYERAFDSWGAALKAAKTVAEDLRSGPSPGSNSTTELLLEWQAGDDDNHATD
jgi:DNA modification methylase